MAGTRPSRMAEARTRKMNDFLVAAGLVPDRRYFRDALAAQTSSYIAPADRDFFGHGSMLDPDPRHLRQGYDSAMFGGTALGAYEPELNVALRIGPGTPLQLVPGNSLISTISQQQPGSLPQLDGCAILTCVGAVPPSDAFRPPYCGPDRELRWRAGALELSRLQQLPPPNPKQCTICVHSS